VLGYHSCYLTTARSALLLSPTLTSCSAMMRTPHQRRLRAVLSKQLQRATSHNLSTSRATSTRHSLYGMRYTPGSTVLIVLRFQRPQNKRGQRLTNGSLHVDRIARTALSPGCWTGSMTWRGHRYYACNRPSRRAPHRRGRFTVTERWFRFRSKSRWRRTEDMDDLVEIPAALPR